MTYNPNVPSGTDIVSSDLSQMQVNFSQANTLFANDHWEFNNGVIANRGYHRQVTIPAVQSVDPTLVSPAGEFYTKTVSSITQAFFSNGTNVTQLTGLAQLFAQNGNITFNGGMQFKWGFVDTTYLAGVVDNQFFFYPDGPNPFDSTKAFPTITWQVFIQGIANSTNVHSIYLKSRDPINDLNRFGFKLRTDQTWPSGFMYFAIGN